MVLEELSDFITVEWNVSARPFPVPAVKEIWSFLNVHAVIRRDREIAGSASVFVHTLHMNIAVLVEARIPTVFEPEPVIPFLSQRTV